MVLHRNVHPLLLSFSKGFFSANIVRPFRDSPDTHIVSAFCGMTSCISKPRVEKRSKQHSEITPCSSSTKLSLNGSVDQVQVRKGMFKCAFWFLLLYFRPGLPLVTFTFTEVKASLLEWSFFPFHFLQHLPKNRKSIHFFFAVFGVQFPVQCSLL